MSNRPNPYRAAGTFAGPSYTERKADKDLLRAIEQNQRFPYVLAPRQSGKSSLITHARAKLAPPQYRTAFVDFSIFDPGDTSDIGKFQMRFFSEWHRSLRVNLPLDPSERFLDRIDRLLQYFPDARLITFMDEIDALLPLEFKDTFFSIVRNTFNERATIPEFTRIQFVLAGAARPEELISDHLRSPFNVGESIVLDEFSLKETIETCTQLAEVSQASAADIAEAVYSHANGSVYLTQLILEKLWNVAVAKDAEWRTARNLKVATELIVEEIIARADHDIHFKNIKMAFQSRKEAASVFRKVVADRSQATPSERELLWFTGLSSRDGTRLYRNQIYERVFQSGGPLDLEVEVRARFGDSVVISIPHNLPSLPPFFGRADELKRIADALDPESRIWGALIDGPGGIGKTSLAVRAAYDVPADDFDKIVFVSLKARELDDDGIRDLSGFLVSGLSELLNELARELGHSDIAKAPVEDRPRLLLDVLRTTRTLLVLDNLESLVKTERDTVFTFVKRLPPGSKAIITSRTRIGSAAEELILTKLSEEDALATLAKLAETNTALAKSSEEERRMLYRETGGNPLLLRWVAGQIGRGSCTTFNDAIAYLHSCPTGNDPLEFIFGDVVENFSEIETRVLCALSYFTLPARVEHIAEVAGYRADELGPALRSLNNRSLVVVSEELGTFAIAPRVADLLRTRKPEVMAETGERLEEYVYILAVENGYDQSDRFPNLDAAWPTVAAALPRFQAGPNERLQTVCAALSEFLQYTGRWDELIALSLNAEGRAKTANDFMNAGWRAYRAGRIYYLRGQSAEVIASADRAQSYWAKIETGDRERAYAIQMRGMGNRLLKDYATAAEHFREAVAIWRTLDDANGDIAIGLNDLADTERLTGDWQAAERDYSEALGIAKSLDFREGVANITGNLASLAFARHDPREAEYLCRSALNVAEEVGRLDLIGQNSGRLAAYLLDQGKKAEALEYAQRAVEIFSQLDSPFLGEALKILEQCR